MSYVPGFKNDVFISYAHADNEENLQRRRTVTTFVQELGKLLRTRGLSSDGVNIFLDRKNLGSNRVVSEALVDEVRQSAMFVAISSPAYQEREHTIRELEAFLERPGPRDSLFIVELLPLTMSGRPHPAIEKRLRTAFWVHDDDQHITLTIDPDHHPKLYTQRLTKFSDELSERMKQIRAEILSFQTPSFPAPSARPPSVQVQSPAPSPIAGPASSQPAFPFGRQKVVLAQTTDDLEYESAQVRATLTQFGIDVLPHADYPQGGAEFRNAFSADLAAADLFVQLLGRSAGRMPADMPEGYPAFQYGAARAAGKPILSWRHPELDLETVSNPAHRAFLAGETVMATGLEAFKTALLKMLEDLREPPRKGRGRPSMVYIGADRSDLPWAEQLHRALMDMKVPVALPYYGESISEVQQDLMDNLIDSDRVVVLHGSAPVMWVRSFLRRLNQSLSVRPEPHELTALVKVPPPKTEDINQSQPNLKVIDCSSGFDVAQIVSAMGAFP